MKIQLKRSQTVNSGAPIPPTVAAMEYGELAVNYNASDPTIFIKDSANQIVEIASVNGNNKGQLWSDAGNKLYPTNISSAVGIGTNNPSAPLTIQNATSADIHLIKSGTTNSQSSITFDGTKLDTTAPVGGSINFNVGTNLGAHIDGSGNVGIKKSAPTAALDVSGNGAFSGKVTSSATLDSDGDSTLVTKGYVTSLAGNVVTSNATWTQVAATGDDPAKLYPKNISTRVGIAQQNPAEILDVNGNVKVSGGVYYTVGLTSADDGMFLTDKAYVDAGTKWEGTSGSAIYPKDTSTQVGIGTSTPRSGVILDVAGSLAATNYRIDLLPVLS